VSLIFLAFSRARAYVDQYKIDMWHCMDMTRRTLRMLTWPNDRSTRGSTDDRWKYGY
jgi:hypothetical protein